jgi:hypothetical protein
MGEILRFFKENEIFIYLILGIFGLWQMRQFGSAWRELRTSAFGLERKSAQARLNRVTYLLVMIFMMGVAEFILVSFVAPIVPSSSPLITPTLDLLATPTALLGIESSPVESTEVPTNENATSICVPDQIEIVSPQDDDTIHDIVEIRGSADIPNFAFYKFEMTVANETSWLTIQAGETITNSGRLGYWDTSRLTPGEYDLRLIVVDNQGNPSEPCVIRVRVDPPTELE